MRVRRIVCLLVALIMMIAMSTVTADAASFKSKPTGVKAKCVSGVSVSVSCKAKKGAAGYYFYYSKSKNKGYKLGAKSTKATGTVNGLTPGKTYYFKVKAYKGKGKKSFTKMSKPAKCKTVFKAPSVTVSTQCCCKINVTITKMDGAKGYIIYRSTDSSSGFSQVAIISSTTWQDNELKGSTNYYYKVKAYNGSYYSPLSGVQSAKTQESLGDGNDDSKYGLEHCGSSAFTSDLAGRNMFFLGSSITYGYSSDGVSFVDYIAARNLNKEAFECIDKKGNRKTPEAGDGVVWKEAVSGTTMARVSGNVQTYSYRLYRYYKDTQINPDVFVCQLSLNDANKGIPIGEARKITDDDSLNSLFDNAYTVAGSIEFITAFAHSKWPGCKVVFYTISHFDGGYSGNYNKMVDLLYEEASLNDFTILDLWNDSTISAWKGNVFCLYMNDAHHPKKAGYLQWTPYFEEFLAELDLPVPQYYEVKWEDENGVLETDGHVRRGVSPSYDGDTPTKEADDNYTYEFLGWKIKGEGDGQIYNAETLKKLGVTSNMTFVAEFESIPKESSGTESPEPNIPAEPETTNNPDVQGSPAVDEPTDDGNSEDGTGQSKEDYDVGPDTVSDITGMIQSLLRAA